MLLEARVDRPVTEVEAVRLAREFYGLEATARALPGEYDDNFHLTTAADGQAFVLKVMHPAREHSFIDLQCQALRHLAQRAPQLPVPGVIPSCSGELFTSIAATDGCNRLVWLLTFLNGKVLAEVRLHTPELLRDLGRFLGELDAALQSFTHPAAQRELKWDSSRADWIKDYIKHIGDSKRRALVEKFLALYALIAARLAVSVTNSAHRKTVKPDDPYVTVSEEPAWEALERLAKVHPRFAHYTFRAACGFAAVPQSEKVKKWLQTIASSAASILEMDLRTTPSVVFDLSVGSTFLGCDPSASETPR